MRERERITVIILTTKLTKRKQRKKGEKGRISQIDRQN